MKKSDLIDHDIHELLTNPYIEQVGRFEFPSNPMAAFFFTDNKPSNSAFGVLVDKRTRKILTLLTVKVSGSTKRVPVFSPSSFLRCLKEEISFYFFRHLTTDNDMIDALHNGDKAMVKKLDGYFYSLVDFFYRMPRHDDWEPITVWPKTNVMCYTTSLYIEVLGKRRRCSLKRAMSLTDKKRMMVYDLSTSSQSNIRDTYSISMLHEFPNTALPTPKEYAESERYKPLFEMFYRDYDSKQPPKKEA